VLKFQFDRASFERREASANFGVIDTTVCGSATQTL